MIRRNDTKKTLGKDWALVSMCHVAEGRTEAEGRAVEALGFFKRKPRVLGDHKP